MHFLVAGSKNDVEFKGTSADIEVTLQCGLQSQQMLTWKHEGDVPAWERKKTACKVITATRSEMESILTAAAEWYRLQYSRSGRSFQLLCFLVYIHHIPSPGKACRSKYFVSLISNYPSSVNHKY